MDRDNKYDRGSNSDRDNRYSSRRESKNSEDFIFGVRSVIEAIKAGRDLNKVLIQKGMEKELFIELKEELIKLGHHFVTTSDTEVVIKAYEEWGVECQNHFNGMWAFALWDSSKQLMFISRDRIGEKPLHYSVFENSFIFGSEMKSLFSYGVPKDPDLSLLELYLILSNIPEPFTFFKNIKKGHC